MSEQVGVWDHARTTLDIALMHIETWFPLAVATSDLAPTAAVTAGMLRELEPFIAAAAAQRRLGFAWTGDVNECADIHMRPPFAWLRDQVERETLEFVTALGWGVSRVQLYFQGSWPVLSTGSESVASHAHREASLSAVYYLQVPAGAGGTLVFENVRSPNEMALGDAEVGSARAANSLNAAEACYAPREGRLLLFPSRQPHSVRPHEAEELRISITFDIALLVRDPDDGRAPTRPEASWDAFADS